MKRTGKFCALAIMFLLVFMALPQSAVAPEPPLPFWKTEGNVATPEDVFGTINEEDLRIITNGTQRMVVTSDGNIGIGTTSPSGRLEVAGDIVVSGLVDGIDIDVEVKDLWDAIDAEAAARAAGDDALQEGLGAEEAARIAADTALQEGLDAEEAARIAADTALQGDIDLEEAERIAADALLQAGIDAEEAARIGADAVLQAAIDAEEAARIAADNSLQTDIDDLEAEDALDYDSLADIETAVVNGFNMATISGNVGIGTLSPGVKLDVVGAISVNNHNILNLADPVNDQDAATKLYVDSGDFWIGGSEGPGEVPSDAMALWHMDEGIGSTIYDETENDNDGTIYGATWTTGKYGEALSFDGIDDYVNIPDSESLDITDEITIQVWTKPGGPNPLYRRIIGKPHDYDAPPYFMYSIGIHEYTPFFDVTLDGTHREIFADIDVEEDQWCHLVGTYDGTDLKIYIDGELRGTASYSGTITTNDNPVEIGLYHGQWGDRFYNGVIDEPAILNRALSASEVEDLYNNGFSSGVESIYYNNGNVGIGTLSPGVKLDVVGAISVNNYNILNVADPVNPQDATTKNYVDSGDFWIGGSEGSGEVPSGALAFWHMDEGTGSTIYDETEYENDGTINGATWTTGKYGNALSFDGIDDYVEVTSVIDDIDTSEGSIELWVKRAFENTVSTDQMMLSLRVNTNNNIELFYNEGTDFWNLKYKAGGITTEVTPLPNDIPKNTWIHVVLTWDTAADEVKAYLNGNQVGSTVNGLGVWSGSINAAAIGRFAHGPASFFNGIIDEVAIFDRALSASEIEDLYNDGFSNDVEYIYYNTGNVGIGTITPSEKLEVAGTVKAISFIGDGGSLTGVVKTESDPVFTASPANGITLTDITNWNTAHIGVQSLQTSLDTEIAARQSGDENLQDNIQDLAENMNEKMDSLKDNMMDALSNLAAEDAQDYDSLSDLEAATSNGINLATSSGNVGIGTSVPTVDFEVWGTTELWGATSVYGAMLVDGAFLVIGAKWFKIDYPLDPLNKTLSHASIESSELKNLYDGIVELDENGEAIVELPEWFEALNKDFRYQLTCIGGYAPVYIAEEISDNQFKIAGGNPGLKVSWQVTGIRHDPYAEYYDFEVVEEKPDGEKGTYLNPDVYD